MIELYAILIFGKNNSTSHTLLFLLAHLEMLLQQYFQFFFGQCD